MSGYQSELIELFRNKLLTKSSPNPFSNEITLSGIIAKMILRFKFVLTNTTGTGAISEGELQIIKGITFRTDKGEQMFLNAPGKLLYRVDQAKNGAAAVKDAASTTAGTFYVDIVLNFIDPQSIKPFLTALDTSRYNSVELNIQMGAESDWLGTVGDANLTCTLDCYIERINGLPANMRPLYFQQVGVALPANPAAQTYLTLERASDLFYKRLYIFTTNSATLGVSHTGTANSSVISELNLETSAGFPFKTVLADVLNRRNKQDLHLESAVVGQYLIDLIKSGDINDTLYSGRFSKFQINWVNGTLSTSQVSCGYEAVRRLAA